MKYWSIWLIFKVKFIQFDVNFNPICLGGEGSIFCHGYDTALNFLEFFQIYISQTKGKKNISKQFFYPVMRKTFTEVSEKIVKNTKYKNHNIDPANELKHDM